MHEREREREREREYYLCEKWISQRCVWPETYISPISLGYRTIYHLEMLKPNVAPCFWYFSWGYATIIYTSGILSVLQRGI